MQLHHTLLAVLIASSLAACGGGNLEGGGSASATETPVTETPVTETPVTGTPATETPVEAISGDPAYFTYEGAEPAWIAIKGTGGIGRKESATIVFKLVDANGDIIVGEPVTFSLDQFPYGSILLVEDGVTDANGLVNTAVKSGAGTGPIVITAKSVNYPDIQQVSNSLAVSTGLPDQDSFTLASDVYNIEALASYSETANISVNLGGATGNNSVVDGTDILFRAEGGVITPTCKSLNNACSVVWKATNPRPDNGRVTITAYASGTESFTDAKPSDGKFNEGEEYVDVSEVFQDYNSNGVYDYGEIYIDVMDVDGSISGDFSIGDGKYTGVQCEEGATHCNHGKIYIFDNIELVLSGTKFTCQFSLPSVDLTSTNPVELEVSIFDENGNIPPFETTIVATANNGVIDGQSSWSVGNSNAYGTKFKVKMKNEVPLNEVTDDSLLFTITTPKGKVDYCSIDVKDSPEAVAAP